MKLFNHYLKIVKIESLFKSPDKTFILIAGLFGVLFILLTPAFTGPDEEAHFVRAYGITEGKVILKDINVMMPTSYRKTLGCMQTKHKEPGQTYTYRYENYGNDKHRTIKCTLSVKTTPKKEPVITTASGYSPTTYIPQLLAIFVGKLFNAPIVFISYLARFAVLLGYLALMAIAIRILPERKWALAGIALLPPALIQVVNPGGDYMLLGASAIFVATIIRSRTLNAKELARQGTKLKIIATIAAICHEAPMIKRARITRNL